MRSGAFPGSVVWQAAYPVITYNSWKSYGDLQLIDRHWDGLVALADYWARQPCSQKNQNLCGGLGDWVDTLWPVENTDAQATSSFYNTLSVAYMSEIATALGRSAEAAKYAGLFDTMSAAFFDSCESCDMWASCCEPSRHANKTSQTSFIMLLALNLAAPPLSKTRGPVPAALVPAVAANLVANLANHTNHTTSGIVGETFVFDILVAHGYGDVALSMLLRDDAPSVGYMISQGATTLWENWQGQLPQGASGSNNHIMFGGGVGTILYKALAGLANGGIAWREVAMRPLPAAIERLGSANASVKTPHGLAAISWRRAGRSLELNATVPAGSTAEVVLPASIGNAKVTAVTESGAAVWGDGRCSAPPGAAGFVGFTPRAPRTRRLRSRSGLGGSRSWPPRAQAVTVPAAASSLAAGAAPLVLKHFVHA